MKVSELGLYKLVVNNNTGAWLGIVIAASLAGLLQGCIVVIINQVAGNLIDGESNVRYLLLFTLTIAAYGLTSHYANARAVAVTEGIVFSTYVNIADKIRNARTLAFEGIGKSRIYKSLQTNTDIVLESAKSLAGVGAAVNMIAFSVIYIGVMSRSALVAIVVFYLFGLFVYLSNLRRTRDLLATADANTDRFKGLFSFFLEGFKEIKVDDRKGNELFTDYIQPHADKASGSRIRVENQVSINTVFIQSFYYIIIAAMIFLLPRLGTIDAMVVIKIAAVVLFSYGSMTRIVQAVPLIMKSENAIRQLDALDKELGQAAETAQPYSNRLHVPRDKAATLQARDVVFHYPGYELDSQFTLGPLSLDIGTGQIVFIVGSNGSGKTTLLKLLSGLYQPDSGEFMLDGQVIDDKNYADYRNLFNVIFPDYYLFDRFYGKGDIDPNRVAETLSKVGLGQRVQWHDEQFTDLNLSAGQRKRLALLGSYIDDSPILVMDEVAADLDPEFRRFFYRDFLQQLQAQGKTIIAVSHDERYFDVADQVIKIENGLAVAGNG